MFNLDLRSMFKPDMTGLQVNLISRVYSVRCTVPDQLTSIYIFQKNFHKEYTIPKKDLKL